MPAHKNVPTKVIIHPLVLLSTVDHYNRIAKDTKKRVVGVLLGEIRKTKNDMLVDITNSYAVPFEEDDLNPGIWFLDHNFLENMGGMFKKVNARENVVGWYSTGPRIRPADLDVNELFRKYTPNPTFVIIDVSPKEEFEIPTKAYVALEEVKEDATEAPALQFHHIQSEIGALEAEEVGVEHLLRDVKDTSISTLATELNGKLLSLKSLISHLSELHQYLTNVSNGRLPPNHQILAQLQDIFNLSPNLNIHDLANSFSIKTNDMMVVIYLSTLIRSVIALHSLINNKLENRDAERRADLPEKKSEKKDADKKDAEKKDTEKKDTDKKDTDKKDTDTTK